MKQKLLILIGFFIIASCSSVKRSQQALNQGNYNEAIAIAVGKLQKDKTRKGNQEHILILEAAFKKMTETEKKRIAFLKKEGNAVNSREIYQIYNKLNRIQNTISPLLPLYIEESGRQAKFRFTDYSDEIIAAKNAYAEVLYRDGKALMQQGDKLAYRNAYTAFNELQRLSPNYKDTEALLAEAHFQGTDFVVVELHNQTPFVIPRNLENELLNFNTYGLDDFWTEYHAFNNTDYKYDFAVNLNFREIHISPERVLEREIPLEAEISDGYSYKRDRKGEYMLDSLGNKIKIENFIKVKGTLYQTIQTKSLALEGKVDYLDLEKRQLMKSYPLETEFVFENVYARFKGDDRLLSKEDRAMLKNGYVPFPSNEQMLVDASDDIKGRLVPILKRNKLR